MGLLDIIGTSWDDPKTMAALQLAGGLLGGQGNTMQRLAGGLNAYGASTWGQFFIYQGFNERCGWMHTTSAVDGIDRYLETVVKKGDGYVYKYGSEERPVASSVIKVPYKTDKGMADRSFTV